MEPIGTWATGFGITAAAGLAYSAGYEVRAYTLREVSVPILEPSAQPISVLHLSDLHLTPKQLKKQQWIRSLAATVKPDLVVVTGDFLAHQEAVAPVLASFEEFRGTPGVFVFGSNDYYGPKLKNPVRYLFQDKGVRIHDDPLPWRDLKSGLEELGWVDLTHVRHEMQIKDSKFEFRGVDDPHLQLDDYSTVAGAAAAGRIPIGVTHAPYLRILDAMAADSMAVILAGHTHGGQLCIPGYGALVTNCDLDLKRAKGLHRHMDSWLHVSAGLGTNPYTPVRFACRPEATHVRFLPQNLSK